jgi:hypothetical protein
MSIVFTNPARRAGRPRCSRLALLALEYLMHPAPRPPGLQKQLAYENGVPQQSISTAVVRIKNRIKEDL